MSDHSSRPGRPRKAPEERRRHQILCIANDEEKRGIEQRAEAAGLSRNSYLIRAALRRKVVARETLERWQSVAEIGLLCRAHQRRFEAQGLASAAEAMDEVRAAIAAFLYEINDATDAST